jgi:hypothetical protein
MFALNIQSFIYDSQNCWYNNGYKTGTTKVFLSKSSLLRNIDINNNTNIKYYTNTVKNELVESNLVNESNFLNFLSEDGDCKLKNKNDEFVFYQINNESYIFDRKLNKIQEEEDECFYNTFDIINGTYKLSISQQHFFRIVCKRIEENEEIWFSTTEQYEPNYINLILKVNYNKRISTPEYMFRIGKEIEDLNYYFSKDNKDDNKCLYYPIPVLRCKTNDSNLENIDGNENIDIYKTEDVHIFELALWILKNTTSYCVEDLIWNLCNDKEYILSLDKKMNTLLPNYTLEEAVKECCHQEEVNELLEAIHDSLCNQ